MKKLYIWTILIALSVVASFFQTDEFIKMILHYIVFPFWIGFIVRDIIVKSTINTVKNKYIIISLYMFLVSLIGTIPWYNSTSYFTIIILGWIYCACMAYYFWERKNYITKFDLHFFILKSMLFLYLWSYVITILYFNDWDINVFFIKIFSLFLLLWTVLFLTIRYYLKNKTDALMIFFNILWVFMSLWIWLYYFLSPIFSFIIHNSQAFNPNIFTFINFIIVGGAIWYIFQQILMLGWYLRWKHQHDSNFGIKYANKKFLERVPSQLPSIGNTSFFLLWLIVMIGFLHYHIYQSFMIYDSLPNNPGIWTLLMWLFLYAAFFSFYTRNNHTYLK